jgi:hypothetical protein
MGHSRDGGDPQSKVPNLSPPATTSRGAEPMDYLENEAKSHTTTGCRPGWSTPRTCAALFARQYPHFHNARHNEVAPFNHRGNRENSPEAGVLFHTDAVQTAGKLPLDVGKWGVDMPR